MMLCMNKYGNTKIVNFDLMIADLLIMHILKKCPKCLFNICQETF